MTSPNPPIYDLRTRYREALQALVEPEGDGPLRGLGTLPPEEVLDLVEKQILNEADLGDGIDPVIMLALDIPGDLGVEGYNRRTNQIARESGEDTVMWVIGRTKAEYEKRTAISVARMKLLVALDQIAQSLNEAEAAVKALDDQLDLQIITGPAKPMLTAAFTHMRLLYAGAATYAPKLED
jgi:hypothetical protein